MNSEIGEKILNLKSHLIIITALFLITRILYLFTPAGSIGDADQAVFGMMAQKITAFEEFPFVYWENQYAGAAGAYIAAMIFHFFGSGFVQLRTAMMLIVLPGLFLFYFIYRRLFDGNVALISSLFLVFCPYLVLNYTTGAYGGYGESFLGTALIILMSWKMSEQAESQSKGCDAFLLGLVSGFFVYIQFYAIPAVLVFAIPAVWRTVGNRRNQIMMFSGGGLIGIAPLIVDNVMTGGATLTRAAAWMLLIGREDISMSPLMVFRSVVLQKSAYLADWLVNAPFMFGQYVMPGLFGRNLQIASGIFLMAVFACYIVVFIKGTGTSESLRSHHKQFAFYLLVFILFQWVASLRASRHFMPIFPIIPIAFWGLSEKHALFKMLSGVALMVLSVFQAIGWNQDFRTLQFDPRPVVQVMERRGIREFYTSYWTGYPIMFIGNGNLIGSPMLLPFHEPFGDRRPAYTEQVLNSRAPAFFFGSGETSLESEFLSFLRTRKIRYTKIAVQGGRIYDSFSQPVAVSFRKKGWQTIFSLKQIN